MAFDHIAFRATSLFVCLLASSGLVCLSHLAGVLMGSVRFGPPEVPLPLGSVIAVHLGNTKSFVSGYGNSHAGTVFRLRIPSWVAFSDDGAVLVGEAAKNRTATDPQDAVFGFKRLLGKRFDHEDVQRAANNVPYKIVNKETSTHILVKSKTITEGSSAAKQFHYVEVVAAMVLAELKAHAEAYHGRKVHDAVATVPYYVDASRRAAMDAATFAGLETVRIIDEPTAAAVLHGLHEKLRNEGNVLVLHLGGGTADATVLTYEDGVFETMGSCHDLHLGGEDFDQRIMDYFIEIIQKKHGIDVSNDTIATGKLRTECERAKKELSNQEVAHVNVESLDFSESLTRAKFEELGYHLFQKVIALVEKAMVGSNLAMNNELVDEIVLVSGSARIPRIQELISIYFDAKEISTAVEPDEAVVHGGALLSHPMAGGFTYVWVLTGVSLGLLRTGAIITDVNQMIKLVRFSSLIHY